MNSPELPPFPFYGGLRKPRRLDADSKNKMGSTTDKDHLIRGLSTNLYPDKSTCTEEKPLKRIPRSFSADTNLEDSTHLETEATKNVCSKFLKTGRQMPVLKRSGSEGVVRPSVARDVKSGSVILHPSSSSMATWKSIFPLHRKQKRSEEKTFKKKEEIGFQKELFDKKLRTKAEDLYNAFLAKYLAFLNTNDIIDLGEKEYFDKYIKDSMFRHVMFETGECVGFTEEGLKKATLKAWRKFKSPSGPLLRGTLLRLTVFNELLTENAVKPHIKKGTQHKKKTSVKQKFVEDISAELKKIIVINNTSGKNSNKNEVVTLTGDVKHILKIVENIECRNVRQFFSYLIGIGIKKKLEKYAKMQLNSSEFKTDFERLIWISYYIRNIKNIPSLIPGEEIEKELAETTSKDILNTFTPDSENRLQFQKITLYDGKKKIILAPPEYNKKSRDAIYRTLRTKTKEGKGDPVFLILFCLVNQLVECRINDRLSDRVCKEIVTKIIEGKDLSDASIEDSFIHPESESESMSSEVESSMDEKRRRFSSNIMKVLNAASFKNANSLKQVFYEEYPGIFKSHWSSYRGLYPEIFSAEISNDSFLRSLKIHKEDESIFVDQIAPINIFRYEELFLTGYYTGRTIFNCKTGAVSFDTGMHIPKKSLENLYSLPPQKRAARLSKFITVMRYRPKGSHDLKANHDEQTLIRLGLIKKNMPKEENDEDTEISVGNVLYNRIMFVRDSPSSKGSKGKEKENKNGSGEDTENDLTDDEHVFTDTEHGGL